ncbi:hypothetical protein AVEN_273812-1 [Araneus ventricosus]|uniref:Uncharacterized protein n=1 Tax=Araneus ventricosus TaxID=182803 RepID=A0A4Y2F8V9_ARAVE|nr:hypothetical protein AVEN_273812-1 [Araneus ventricosus]
METGKINLKEDQRNKTESLSISRGDTEWGCTPNSIGKHQNSLTARRKVAHRQAKSHGFSPPEMSFVWAEIFATLVWHPPTDALFLLSAIQGSP